MIREFENITWRCFQLLQLLLKIFSPSQFSLKTIDSLLIALDVLLKLIQLSVIDARESWKENTHHKRKDHSIIGLQPKKKICYYLYVLKLLNPTQSHWKPAIQ